MTCEKIIIGSSHVKLKSSSNSQVISGKQNFSCQFFILHLSRFIIFVFRKKEKKCKLYNEQNETNYPTIMKKLKF